MANIACSSITACLSGLSCGTNPGGITELYIANFSSITNVSSTGGTVTGFTGGASAFYTYTLRPNTGNVQEELVKDLAAGSLFYRQTATFPLAKIDKTKRDQLALLNNGVFVVIAKHSNGTYWLYGHGLGTIGEGAYVTTNVASTGTVKADPNGYTITIVAEEADPAYPVDSSIITGLLFCP